MFFEIVKKIKSNVESQMFHMILQFTKSFVAFVVTV